MSGWKWYGVKTAYRLEPSGEPESTDRDYWGDGSLVEERVVLFRARSFDDAIRKAEDEAKRYAAGSTDRNPYGQPLTLRYLETCDAYELTSDDSPASGTEVFSMTELVPRSVSDDAVLNRRFGREESTRTRARRKNFCLLLFHGPVPGVRPTKAEIADARRYGLLREQ